MKTQHFSNINNYNLEHRQKRGKTSHKNIPKKEQIVKKNLVLLFTTHIMLENKCIQGLES